MPREAARASAGRGVVEPDAPVACAPLEGTHGAGHFYLGGDVVHLLLFQGQAGDRLLVQYSHRPYRAATLAWLLAGHGGNSRAVFIEGTPLVDDFRRSVEEKLGAKGVPVEVVRCDYGGDTKAARELVGVAVRRNLDALMPGDRALVTRHPPDFPTPPAELIAWWRGDVTGRGIGGEPLGPDLRPT